MNLFRRLARLWNSPQGPRRRPAARPRPAVEVLEDRTVPTVLYSPDFGNETVYGGNDRLSSVPVNLIFWGGAWGDESHPSALATQVKTAVQRILSGGYLSGLTQYGADGKAHLDQVWYSNYGGDPDPYAAGGFSDQNVIDVVENSTKSRGLHEPDDYGAHKPLYMVIAPPGAYTDNGALGYHGEDTYHKVLGFLDSEDVFYGVVTSNPTADAGTILAHYKDPSVPVEQLGTLDSITTSFSHELVEAITDPWASDDGLRARRGASFPSHMSDDQAADTENEIGDWEAQYHNAVVNGVRVQSYWSDRDQAFIVPGQGLGSSALTLDDGLLTARGDQTATDDSLTLYATNEGGVGATVNGEDVAFSPGTVRSVLMQPGGGDNTVDVWGIPQGVSVTYDGAGSDAVNVGLFGFTEDVKGSLAIRTSTGGVALSVSDASSAIDRDVTVDASGLGGLTGEPITWQPGSLSNLSLGLGAGNNRVQLNQTPGGVTRLSSRGHGDVVRLGGGDMDDVAGEVDLSLGQGATLVLDDSSSGVSRSATLSGSVSGLGPATITWTGAPDSLSIDGSAAGNTWNVRATDCPTSLIGSGPDLVRVGADGSMAGVAGDLTVSNPGHATTLVLDDGADATGRAVRLSVSHPSGSTGGITPFLVVPPQVTVSGLAPGVISCPAADLAGLTIDGGPGGNAFWLDGVPGNAPVTLNAGAGSDAVSVGLTSDSLTVPGVTFGAAGHASLTINGQGGQDSLTLWDEKAGRAARYNLSGGRVTRSAGPGFAVSYSGLEQLTVQGSRAGSAYVVNRPAADQTFLGKHRGADSVRVLANVGPVYFAGKLLRVGRVAQLRLLVPSGPVVAGKPFRVVVVALDAGGNRVAGYRGMVHFDGPADAALPKDYAFTTADHGIHAFKVCLSDVGSQSLRVSARASNGPAADEVLVDVVAADGSGGGIAPLLAQG